MKLLVVNLELRLGNYKLFIAIVMISDEVLVCIHLIFNAFTSEFRNGSSPILVATDVASRGLGMEIYFDIHLFEYLVFISLCA